MHGAASCPPSGPAARGAAYEPLEGQRALFLAGRRRARALVVAARLSRAHGAGGQPCSVLGLAWPGHSRVRTGTGRPERSGVGPRSLACAHGEAQRAFPLSDRPGEDRMRSPRQCLECFEGPVVEPRAEWVVGVHFDHMPLGQEFLLLGCFLTMVRSPRPFKLMVHVMSPI